MATTIDSLITDYAQDIASEAGLDAADYQRTAAGLASLLTDTAADMPAGQVRDWLTDAAADLDAYHRANASGDQARTLLTQVDARLYEAHYDLT
ncbi:hypothetical protein [Streptomyces rubrogriseus]|uniref:hypothetical protein n=1 Tax=Streptomyces rubrogriseus TaxID=194673 RepID=UPI000D59F6F2|nr:hypothetical protein [Streptomyces rubrogriseus]